MSKLFSWLAPFKSHLFALVGVIAIAGIGSTVAAYFHIKEQRATIGSLVEANRGWSEWADGQLAIRSLEQENTRLLQEQLGLIEERSAEQSEQLKRLEESNAEVKEFMSRRIPADLRRLLNKN